MVFVEGATGDAILG